MSSSRGGVLAAVAVALLVSTIVAWPPAAAGDDGAAAVTPAADARPNVLLLITDDQAWSTFDRARMPTVFSELVDRGTTFERAYVHTPMCCPSRAQILTGLYQHHTAVDLNRAPLTRPVLPRALRQSGYRTALAGKYLNSMPCTPVEGFDQWMCAARNELRDPTMNVNGTVTSFTGYAPDIQASFLRSFITSVPTTRPFFAVFAPTSPHLPGDDDRCTQTYPLHRPASYDEETRTTGHPVHMQRPPLSATERAQNDADWLAMNRAVRCLDRAMGTVLSALGDRADNTLVVFLSDNGYLYGEHRRSGKTVPYEESVRVPMVVRYPALGGGLTRTPALVSNLDVAATVAAAAGLRWPSDGRSLLPLLRGSVASVRDALLLSHCQSVSHPCPSSRIGFDGELAVPSWNAVVQDRHKLIEYETGEAELFDLVADPAELMNRAGDASMVATLAAMRQRMSELRAPPPPETAIVTGPHGAWTRRVVTFTYLSQSPAAVYQCRLDVDGVTGAWEHCPGGSHTVGPLPDGSFAFRVRGVDEHGEVDGTPAARSFSISSSGPPVSISSAPPLDSSDRTARFALTNGSATGSYECRLGSTTSLPAWRPCDPQVELTGLADGTYAFQARAVDPESGARTRPPAEHVFRVDEAGPTFLFDWGPRGPTRSDRATFAFRPDQRTTGRWWCQVDTASPVSCSHGGHVATGLVEGRHVLRVTGTDLSGVSRTTALAWLVDRTAPGVAITSAPPGITSSATATFEFTADEPAVAYFCRLDAEWFFSPCTSPVTYSPLAPGTHRFEVKARDAAKNFSVVVGRSWTVL